MIQPIKKGQPFLTQTSIEKIKETGLTEKIIKKLYDASNDPLQRMLLIEIALLKGFAIHEDEPQIA